MSLRPLATRASLSLLGLAAGLVIAELAVRLLAPQSLVSDVLEMDADLDYRLRPGARGRMTSPEYSAEIHINSFGFRGREISLEKPSGRTRVLFLGDSFVFGHGLADDEALPEQVHRALDRLDSGRYEVVNGGVYGYCTAQELLSLRTFGLPLGPDVVVLLGMAQDLPDNAAWFDLGQDGELAPKEHASRYTRSRRFTRFVPGSAWLRGHSHLFKWVGARLLPVLVSASPAAGGADRPGAGSGSAMLSAQYLFRLAEALLAEVARTARSHGARPILLTLEERLPGAPDSIAARLEGRAPDLGFDGRLALTPLLAAHGGADVLFFARDGHWTPAAVRAVSAAVASEIARATGSAAGFPMAGGRSGHPSSPQP